MESGKEKRRMRTVVASYEGVRIATGSFAKFGA